MDLLHLYRLTKMKVDSDNYQDKILVNMLIIDIAKIELIGGHIGIKLSIEMAKIEINRRPY